MVIFSIVYFILGVNNYHMAKYFDFIIFSLAYFLVGYGLFTKIFSRNLAISLTALVYIVVASTLIFVMIKPKREHMKVEEMPVYLALMPRDEQTRLFYALVPDHQKIKIKSPYFTFQKEDKKVLVACLYRFLNLTQEDIGMAYREGVKEEVNEIIMLTRARERKTLTLTALLPIKFTFPDKYTVFRTLKKHNALPPKPIKPKKVKIKTDKALILSTIFDGKRVKLYLFSALTLALLSFITPLKNYYLICALIPLALGLISYLKVKR